MEDNFSSLTKGLTSPATRHFAIVPDDGADLPSLPRAVYCEAAGTMAMVDADGVELSYTLAQGQVVIFRGVRIKATGTTALLYGWE